MLNQADLQEADLREANLTGALLEQASLVHTDLRGADLSDCRVFGVAVWNLRLDEHTKQANLVIAPEYEPDVSIDNIKVAQLVYLMLAYPEIRCVIDTLTMKTVLIFGRFTEVRKAVLAALPDELRLRGYVPILFDFEKPASRRLIETVSVLTHLARFVIADLTDAKSIGHELAHIVPVLASVPIQPLILEGQRVYGMFEDWKPYGWVLPLYTYADQSALLAGIVEHVITPAEAKAEELAAKRREVG